MANILMGGGSVLFQILVVREALRTETIRDLALKRSFVNVDVPLSRARIFETL